MPACPPRLIPATRAKQVANHACWSKLAAFAIRVSETLSLSHQDAARLGPQRTNAGRSGLRLCCRRGAHWAGGDQTVCDEARGHKGTGHTQAVAAAAAAAANLHLEARTSRGCRCISKLARDSCPAGFHAADWREEGASDKPAAFLGVSGQELGTLLCCMCTSFLRAQMSTCRAVPGPRSMFTCDTGGVLNRVVS